MKLLTPALFLLAATSTVIATPAGNPFDDVAEDARKLIKDENKLLEDGQALFEKLSTQYDTISGTLMLNVTNEILDIHQSAIDAQQSANSFMINVIAALQDVQNA
ncbi:hypothetical protein GGF38_004701, partial [Coemansia sp. RSA 25]